MAMNVVIVIDFKDGVASAPSRLTRAFLATPCAILSWFRLLLMFLSGLMARSPIFSAEFMMRQTFRTCMPSTSF